jgi:hypothetical protein
VLDECSADKGKPIWAGQLRDIMCRGKHIQENAGCTIHSKLVQYGNLACSLAAAAAAVAAAAVAVRCMERSVAAALVCQLAGVLIGVLLLMLSCSGVRGHQWWR